ncbi:hypothetical protein SAY87_014149 [Trapa incisa]|uniref:Histone-lysine N-methyltransferase ASHH3 n=1 Tax=Trapa incisa TaxID=236973 RepID=A0AAN7JL94_9MYRT|nr:hypothetical protein SAY87_014149 [Trapa incisa]
MPLYKGVSVSRLRRVFYLLIKDVGDPVVEFDLPGWFNKWKPNPYTSIRRNIYLTKRIKKRLEDDGIFCSCCPSPGSSVVCGRDCHCGMLLSSCSSGCKCGSSCSNKPFQHRPMKKMKLIQTEKCGAGIVADQDIKKGEFVIEYVGEVIDDKTCEERLWDMKHRGETNFYLCEINRDMVIDATYKGNKSRYINHSCSPNTEMQKWIIDGETRIGIFATRDIKKGEHLTYDYQFVQFGADQDCHCGAAGCRRKLGIKPAKPKISSEAAVKHNTNHTNTQRNTMAGSHMTAWLSSALSVELAISVLFRGVTLLAGSTRIGSLIFTLLNGAKRLQSVRRIEIAANGIHMDQSVLHEIIRLPSQLDRLAMESASGADVHQLCAGIEEKREGVVVRQQASLRGHSSVQGKGSCVLIPVDKGPDHGVPNESRPTGEGEEVKELVCIGWVRGGEECEDLPNSVRVGEGARDCKIGLDLLHLPRGCTAANERESPSTCSH